MKIILSENKIDTLIKKQGILRTIKVLGGYNNFDKIYPDYFYSRDDSNTLQMNRDRVIEFLNECVEVNHKRQNETSIYLNDYWEDILYQEWSDYNEDAGGDYLYESRIISISTDIAHIEVWEYDEEGQVFDEVWEYDEVPLNRLDTKFLNQIFRQIWGKF